MTQIANRVNIPVQTPAGGATATRGPDPMQPVRLRESTTRNFLTGTPGRMRVLAAVASLACVAFALAGFFGLRATDGSVHRAGANTEQVVRLQAVYANLLKADATVSNGFLVGGQESTTQRQSYDDSINEVFRGIAEAANAQPADGVALAALNASVNTYSTTVDEARTYNRQALPVGQQYLTIASSQLRSDVLPIVSAIATANQNRANDELRSNGAGWVVLLLGLIALGVIGYVGWWLAKATHRYVNLPLVGAAALVLAAVLFTFSNVLRVGSTMTNVANGDFKSAVALAAARASAYDAKSNESLTLIKRGSGAANEKAYQAAVTLTKEKLAIAEQTADGANLIDDFTAYTNMHHQIRTADDSGNWDEAVALATSTATGSANATFAAFDQALSKDLADRSQAVVTRLSGLQRPWLVWLVTPAGLLAAAFALRSMSKRLEEYR